MFVKFWFLDEHDQVLVTGFQVNGIPEMQHRDGVMSTKSDATFTSVGCGYGSCKLKTFAVTSDGTLCSFGASCIMERLVSLEATSGKVISVTESYIVVGASSGVARLFNPATLEYRATMPFPPAMGAANEWLRHANRNILHPDRTNRYPATIGVRLSGLHAIVLYSDRSMFVYSVADLDNIQVYRSFLFHSGGIRDLKIAGKTKGVTARGKIIYYNDSQSATAIGNHMIPNGTFITCADDYTLRFWHLDLHKTVAKMSRFSGDDTDDFKGYSSDSGPWKHPLSQEMLRLVYHDTEVDFMSEDSVVLGATCSSSETMDIHTPSVDTGLANGLRVVAIRPNQSEVAVGDREGKITVRRFPSGELVAEIAAHSAEVLCIAYGTFVLSTHQNDLMASGASDRLIHMYGCSVDHKVLDTLENHVGPVTALQFTRDGKQIISCAEDKNIAFTQIHEDGKVNRCNSLPMMSGKIFDMALSSDDDFMVTSCNNRLDIHHISTGNHIKTHHVGEQHHIAICPANYCAAMSGSLSDKTIRVIDINTGDMLADGSGHGELITSVQFTPDCRRLVSTSKDGCIFVWRLSEDIQRTIKSRLPRLNETHGPHPEPPNKAVLREDNNFSLLPPPPPSAPVFKCLQSSGNTADHTCYNIQRAKESKDVISKREIKSTNDTTKSSDTITAAKTEIDYELGGWKRKAAAVPGPMANILMEDWMRTRETAKKTVFADTAHDEQIVVSTELVIDRSQTPDWAKTVKPPQKSKVSSERSQQQVGGKWSSRAEKKTTINEHLVSDKFGLHVNRSHDEEINYDIEDNFFPEDDDMRAQERQLEGNENTPNKDITDFDGKCLKSLSGDILSLSVGNLDFEQRNSVHSPGSLASERQHLEKRKKQIQTANAVAAMNLKLSQLGLIKTTTNEKLSDIIESVEDTTTSRLVDEFLISQTESMHDTDNVKVPQIRNDMIAETSLQELSSEIKRIDARADIPVEMFESFEGPLQICASKPSHHVDESLSTFTHGFMAENSGDILPAVIYNDQSIGKCNAHADQSLSSFSNGYSSVSQLDDNSNPSLFKPKTERELDFVISNVIDIHPKNQIKNTHDIAKTNSLGAASEIPGDLNQHASQKQGEAKIPAEFPSSMIESHECPLHTTHDVDHDHDFSSTSAEYAVGFHRVDESLSTFTQGFSTNIGDVSPLKLDQDNKLRDSSVDRSLSVFGNGYLDSKALDHAIKDEDVVDMSMSAFTTGYGLLEPSKDPMLNPKECAMSLSTFTGGFEICESSTPTGRHQCLNRPHPHDASINPSTSSMRGLNPPNAMCSSLSTFTSGFNSNEQEQPCMASIVSPMEEAQSNDVTSNADQKKSLSSFTLGYNATITSEPIAHYVPLQVADIKTIDAAVVAAFPDNPGKQKTTTF